MRTFFPDHGFVIDTGRSGWPTRSDGPMDLRTHRGNWCNVSDAGIGERPQPAPAPPLENIEIDTVLSNSFGFGGTNACLLFSKCETI